MNFYDLLYASISKSDIEQHKNTSTAETVDDENVCLITYDKLNTGYVKLECGHKFNYQPIFNEVYNQKHHANILESQKLSKHQIKCPYCRNVQSKLLPPKEGFQKSMYVNYPLKYCMATETCKYIFKSGYKKGKQCGRGCFTEYCSTHKQYANLKPLTPEQKLLNDYKNQILEIRKQIAITSEYLKNEVKCNNDACKNNCVGDLTSCYRHATKEEKQQIKDKRDSKKQMTAQIKSIREKIKNMKSNS